MLHLNILNSSKINKFGPVIVRIGLALVFIWFGINQVMGPDKWISLIPDYAINLSGLTAITIVYINGVLEIVLGVLLILGFFTRIVSILLSIHLIFITIEVGYSPIGVRDFGLFMATLSIFFSGPDDLSLDKKIQK